MNQSLARQFIIKYLDGQASEFEKSELLKWLKQEKNQEIFKEYFKKEHLQDIKNNSFDLEEAFTAFLNEIKEKEDVKIINMPVIRRLMKYSAIIIGILLMTAYTLNRLNSEKIPLSMDGIILEVYNGSIETFQIEENKILKRKNGNKIGTIKEGILTYESNEENKQNNSYLNVLRVPYGKQFQVRLVDGTNVYLNSGSVLKFPSNFNNKLQRVVSLEGEAYFEVAKDENIPFIVNTKEIDTKVFGTKFNVSTYANINVTEVVLVEGSVGVQENIENGKNRNDYLIIKPSQKAYKIKDSENISVVDVNVDKYIAWKDGILMFENENMVNILKILERHFNVAIQNNYSELSSYRFTGTFKTEKLDEILKTIRGHTYFLYSKEENKIIINKPQTKTSEI